MENVFTYRILSYTHSQFLEEKLNVGILFYFGNDTPLVFKHPDNFKRVREVYSDFHEWQLKSNLRAIEDKVRLINNDIFSKTVNEDQLINDVLRNDATVLSFSSPKTISDFNGDINIVAENLYNLYFAHYNKIDIKKIKHDEKYLIHSFKNKLYAKKPGIDNLLRKDIQIESVRNTFKTTLKFDYLWQNGVPNLVKPLNFDLEEENLINQKAILLHGQLNFASDKLKINNCNVDLLVSAPTNNNRNLFKAYDNALNILNDTLVTKNIIEEKNLDTYTDRVAEQIHSLLPSYNFVSLDTNSSSLDLPTNLGNSNLGLLP